MTAVETVYILVYSSPDPAAIKAEIAGTVPVIRLRRCPIMTGDAHILHIHFPAAIIRRVTEPCSGSWEEYRTSFLHHIPLLLTVRIAAPLHLCLERSPFRQNPVVWQQNHADSLYSRRLDSSAAIQISGIDTTETNIFSFSLGQRAPQTGFVSPVRYGIIDSPVIICILTNQTIHIIISRFTLRAIDTLCLRG